MKLKEVLKKIKEEEATDRTFGIVFLTQTKPTIVRRIEKARQRPAPKQKNADAFLYFTDTETGLARQCRKRLILRVRFGEEWSQVEM